MKINTLLQAVAVLPAMVSAAALPSDPVITQAPTPALVKRQQTVLSDNIWTSVSDKIIMVITPTIIDGVTISASPITTGTPTPWISLDNSGIPYAITPTVSDGTTLSASPTPTATDYPTALANPPVLRCFGDRVPSTDDLSYPFCTARNGTEVVVGETYWLTWDPTYWGGDDITRVHIQLVAYPQTGSSDYLYETVYISNADGYYPLTIQSSFIRSGNGYFFVTITPLATSSTNAKNTGTTGSSLLRAISSVDDAGWSDITRVPSDNGNDASTTSTSKKSNHAGVIAPAVVVPVVVVGAIAAFVLYFFLKQKKSISGLIHFGGKGGASQNGNASPSNNVLLHSGTTHDDVQTIATATTANSQNPFQDSSRVVL